MTTDHVGGTELRVASLLAPERAGAEELVQVLAGRPGVRVERIVSHGQASPPGFWYDQAEDEWVALLSGAARLEFEGGRQVALAPGDHLMLPAGLRHRVAWTDPAVQTVWLAVFLASLAEAPAAGSGGDAR